MSLNLLLSTIILVSFLITIVMAVGSYVAYKLREARRPQLEVTPAEGESAYFERITAGD
jgi:heme/copper-type cytochrome/quinol oxidase subunit 2